MISLKYIEKQNPPESFVQYSSKSGATFKDLSENHIDVRNELRKSLLTEQGCICCYCGCRIETENTKIEHLKPRQQNPQLQLEYDNLLASCDGGQNARHNGRIILHVVMIIKIILK